MASSEIRQEREINKKKIFPLLQIELDNHSSRLTTFQTPLSRHLWLRMPSILLSKLNSFSVLDDSIASKWFESYLFNRSQVTVCNNSKSDQAIVPIGVPQGSILGPLLFTVYINDLPDQLEHCDITPCADDTVLFVPSKSICDIESKLNSDLGKVSKWLTSNQLMNE
jgi:hypothetical protein